MQNKKKRVIKSTPKKESGWFGGVLCKAAEPFEEKRNRSKNLLLSVGRAAFSHMAFYSLSHFFLSYFHEMVE